MKRASLLAAAAVVLVANAFALVHAWRNRSGVDADITLTNRELNKDYSFDTDNSGIALSLRWTDPQNSMVRAGRLEPWLNQNILRELGFDLSVPAGDDRALMFYQRQRARRGFVALEYNGPAWKQWVDDLARQTVATTGPQTLLQQQTDHASRLIAVDASGDAARLRARHSDRNAVLIVPAVIRIFHENAEPAYPGHLATPARLVGYIQEIPSSIHVPRPFSEQFRGLPNQNDAKFRVHLRYGAALEPWVAGVEDP